MRFLAIDYGIKRCGIAVSDAGESFAFPRRTLERKTKALFFEELLHLVEEEQAGAMGDMTETYMSQMAALFVRQEYEAQGLDLTAIQNAYLMKVGGMMLFMTLLMTISAVLIGLLASRTSAEVGLKLREQLYEKVMRFTNEEMERFSTASLITRSTNDVQQIQMVVVMFLRMVAYAPILAIFGIIRVVQTGSGMGWIIVLAVVILSVCIGILMGVAMPKFRMMQKLIDRLNQVSREILTGVMPIRPASSFSDILRFAIITSRLTIIGMPFPPAYIV